jgi:hypothetical protein
LVPERGVSRPRPAEAQRLVTLAAFFFFIFLVIYVLPPPRPIVSGVDPSWELALTDAFLRGAQFGRDVVITYGPWSLVAEPRGDPRLYPWVVSTRLLMAAAVIVGVAFIATRRLPSRIGQWLWMALVLALADPLAIAPMLLFAVVFHSDESEGKTRTISISLLVAACALSVWGKISGVIFAVALFLVLLAYDIRKRRVSVIAASLAMSSIIFWMLAGQSLFVMPAYVKAGLLQATYFPSAMCLRGPVWQVVLGVLLLLLVVISYGWSSIATGGWKLAPATLWVSFFFFATFKETFVRQDEFHFWFGMMDAFLPAALVLIVAAGFLDRGIRRRPVNGMLSSLTKATPAMVIVSAILFVPVALDNVAGHQRLKSLAWNIRAVFSRPTPSRRIAGYRSDLEELRRKHPIDPIAGTADFFPDNLAVLVANGARLKLRPTPSGFAAFAPITTAANAAFLRSPQRPDFVVFDVAPIDNRYPSLSDPLSLLALLSCYEPNGLTGSYLLLRATDCVDIPRRLIMETSVPPGQPVALPTTTHRPIWAEIEVSQSAAGRLTSLLFRPAVTNLEVVMANHRRRYVLPPPIAQVGFLLSPLIVDPMSYGLLYGENGSDPNAEIREFTIPDSALSRFLLNPEIRIRLYEMDVPKRITAALAPSSLVAFSRSVHSTTELNSQARPPFWQIEQGRARVQVGSLSSGEVDVPAGSTGVSLRFGQLNDCEGLNALSRVHFRAMWRDATTQNPTMLFDYTAETRGLAEVNQIRTLSLPGREGRIALSTEPAGGDCFAGAWWSDLALTRAGRSGP